MAEVNTNQKYQSLCNTARELFLKYGIKRVSVEEICRESGVSKMTFYKYFKNKMEIAIEVIDQFIKSGEVIFNQILESDDSIELKIEKFIQLKIKQNEAISFELFKEILSGKIPELEKYIRNKTAEMQQKFIDWLHREQIAGKLGPSYSPEFILFYLDKLVEISKDPRLLGMFKDHATLTGEMTRVFFYGIIPREKLK